MPIRFSQDEEENKLLKDRPNCPVCGQPMRLLVGAYDYFWGCPSFPICSGKLNVDKENKEDREQAVNQMIKDMWG